MSYTVIIKENHMGQRKLNTWMRVSPVNGQDEATFRLQEVDEAVADSKTLYEQTVESVEIGAVIKAVNGLG
ncbi:MAG: hypothetical protein FJ039_02175 [Chloroflexi bacterium]|nr:hypothetical protein [Chloroflexota bacterium]